MVKMYLLNMLVKTPTHETLLFNISNVLFYFSLDSEGRSMLDLPN